MNNSTNKITLEVMGLGAELVCGKLDSKQSKTWKTITKNGDDFAQLIDHVRHGKEDMVDSDSFLGEWSDINDIYHIHGCNIEDGILVVKLNGKEIFSTELSELDSSIDKYFTWDEFTKGAYFTGTSEENGLFYEAVLPLQDAEDFDSELLTCKFSDVFGREILTQLYYDNDLLENYAVADQESVSFEAEITWA